MSQNHEPDDCEYCTAVNNAINAYLLEVVHRYVAATDAQQLIPEIEAYLKDIK